MKITMESIKIVLILNLYFRGNQTMHFENKYPPKANFKPYQTNTSNFATSIPSSSNNYSVNMPYKTSNSNGITSNSSGQNFQSQFSQQSSNTYQSYRTQPTNQYATSIKFNQYASSSSNNFSRSTSLSKENSHKFGQVSKNLHNNSHNQQLASSLNANSSSNKQSRVFMNNENLSGSRVSQFDLGYQGMQNFKYNTNFSDQYTAMPDYGNDFKNYVQTQHFSKELQENKKTIDQRQKYEKSSNHSHKSQQNYNSIIKYQNSEDYNIISTAEENLKREITVLNSELTFKNSILKSKDKQIQQLSVQLSLLKTNTDKISNQKSQIRMQRQQKQKIFHKMLQTQGQNRSLAEKNRQLQNQLRKQREKNFKSSSPNNYAVGTNLSSIDSVRADELNKIIDNKGKTIDILSQEKLKLQIQLRQASEKIKNQTVQYQQLKSFYKNKIEVLEETMQLLQQKISQRKFREKQRAVQQQNIERLNKQVLQKNQMIKYLQIKCSKSTLGQNQSKSNQNSRKSNAQQERIKNLEQQSNLSSQVIKELQSQNKILQQSRNKILQENFSLQGKIKTLAKQLTIFRTKCNEHQETIKNLQQINIVYKNKAEKYLQQIQYTNVYDSKLKNQKDALQQRLLQMITENSQLSIEKESLAVLQAQQRQQLKYYANNQEKSRKSADQLVQKLSNSLFLKQKQIDQLLKEISSLKKQKNKLNEILNKAHQFKIEEQQNSQQEFRKMKIAISRMTEQIQCETQKLRQIASQNKRLSQQNEKLTKECAQFNKQIKSLSEDSEDIGSEFSQEKERLYAAQQLIAAIQGQNQLNMSKIAQIQLEKSQIQKQVLLLRKQNDSQRIIISRQKQQHQELRKRIQNTKSVLKQESGNFILKIEELQKDVIVFEAQISKMKQINSSLGEQLQRRNTINKQLAQQNDQLSQNHQKIEFEFSRLAEQVRDLRQEYQYVSDLSMEYKSQLQSLQQNYKQLQIQKIELENQRRNSNNQKQNEESEVEQYDGLNLKVSKFKQGQLKYSGQTIRQNRRRLKNMIEKMKEITSKNEQKQLKPHIIKQLQQILPFLIYLTTKASENLIPSTQQLNANASKFMNVSMSAVFCQQYLQILEIFQVDPQIQDHHQILIAEINSFRQSIKMLVDKVNAQQYQINLLDTEKHNLSNKVNQIRIQMQNWKNKSRENQNLIRQLNQMLIKQHLMHFSEKRINFELNNSKNNIPQPLANQCQIKSAQQKVDKQYEQSPEKQVQNNKKTTIFCQKKNKIKGFPTMARITINQKQESQQQFQKQKVE